MERFDLLIVLGSQIGVKNGKMMPAFHTEMKTRAAGIAYQQKICDYFIITGGYNFGVRYDLDLSVPVFGTTTSDRKPDFSEEAKQKARIYRSEASVMAEMLKKEYQVPPEKLILEEDSATTEENAKFCDKILHNLFDVPDYKNIGVLALLYHMQRALEEFKKQRLVLKPVFTENLLVSYDPPTRHEGSWINRVCQYYIAPKDGKQWPVDRIRQLLTEGKSLSELLV